MDTYPYVCTPIHVLNDLVAPLSLLFDFNSVTMIRLVSI